MSRAVYAGSFDPITCGHVHVIQKAAATFEEVVVLVANNAAKSGFLRPAERLELCKAAVAHLLNVTVEESSDRFVVDHAEKIGATHLVRGLPTVADFQYEYELYHNNRRINPKLDTVFVMCDKDVQQVRSSTVRGMIGYRGWVRQVRPLVPPIVLDKLVERFMEQEWLGLAPKFYGREMFRELWPSVLKSLSRPYHNLLHVYDMLELLREFEDACTPLVQDQRKYFLLAVWLHDFVVSSDVDPVFPIACDEELKTPEEKSAYYARWAVRCLDCRDLPSNRQFVSDLILATDYSKPMARDDLQKLIACLDLAVLAKAPDEYGEYVKSIEREYAKKCFGKEFFKGRLEFLDGFIPLSRCSRLEPSEKQLFFGVPFFDSFRERALNNLVREREDLLRREFCP